MPFHDLDNRFGALQIIVLLGKLVFQVILGLSMLYLQQDLQLVHKLQNQQYIARDKGHL